MADDIWLLVDSSTLGGIETHVGVLAAALIRQGLSARVVRLADHGPNPWLAQLEAAGIPQGTPDGAGGGFPALLAALRRARPRLLHTHGYKAGILGRIAARIAGIPCVSTFHAGERGRFPVFLYQWLDGATSFLARRIAVSRTIARAVPFGATVIGNFVPVPATPPSGNPPDVVGFVGRFSAEKGPDLFCALAARLPDIRFEMFGDGAMRPALEQGFRGRVRFHGLVTDPAAIWPRIGLLLMPSRAEGLPLAAIEAMAAGIPVAASRVGALPELITDDENGWLFAPGDLDGMARAVERWRRQDAPARQAMALAAWRTARERHAVETLLPQVRAVYAAAGAAV